MKILEVTKNFEHNGISFKAGHRYVMAEDAEVHYRSVVGDCVGMSYPIDTIYRKYNGENLNGKKLMVWRTGGIGDILFLSCVFSYLKKKYPTCVLKVASAFKQPLENLPEIDELYDMPFDVELLRTVDYMLQFQGIIESSNEASKRTHAADLFFSYFGIDSLQFPAELKRPRIVYSNEELKWLEKTCTELGIEKSDYVIGIQMETSAPLRNFPKEKMKVVIDVLSKEPNVKIVLIGTLAHATLAAFYKGTSPNIIPAITYSIRQSIVLAKRYDLVISPDSFMVQVAGALQTPLVGLYGPFSSDVRMKYFKNAIAIEPKTVCSPCFIHDFRACIRGFPSPCFSLVKPEDILQAVDFLKFKFTKSHFNYMTDFIKIPNLSEVEQYMLGADKGIGFFCGYYSHYNMIRVDTNPFTKPDITDLSSEFKRHYPFVLYMNEFEPNRISIYHGCKALVRPGGYLIVYKENMPDQLFCELKQDIGKSFTILFSKFEPAKYGLIAAKKPY